MDDVVIGVSGLVKNYPNNPAVCNVSFKVRRGEIFALLGPNGAGKTTIIKILEFVERPTSGFAYVLDSEQLYALTKDYTGIKEKIGALPQGFKGFDLLTVYENIDYFAQMYRKYGNVDRIIDEMGLRDKRNALFKHLSGGQKQRVGIAIALINDPEVVFLDEPTTGLDPKARRDVWDMIKGLKARGKTVLLTTHYMDEAHQLADRICVLNRGSIVTHGTPEDLINKYGGGNTLVVRGCSTGAIERLREALPGSLVSGNDVTVRLAYGDGMAAMAKAISVLGGDGHLCQELYVKKPTLEDVFLNLTGERLDDA
ncbi:ABC transporter ATP binding protein [Methanocella paludicola SANAE]|uniref:ABC transporter ATP binding protein n=1 Tax=Methanocella paludicola (strain DSM 17711 / JCM 13418 / NBRC 101707 / SANAE) TaxID=304371 RepID=D1YW12_METPS|nr:ABC transporter ATP-binding protein [Methanocella paludicola]BAI60634.1 ABC transporter ATP binding protein [Methanocella paludicola SANAE]